MKPSSSEKMNDARRETDVLGGVLWGPRESQVAYRKTYIDDERLAADALIDELRTAAIEEFKIAGKLISKFSAMGDLREAIKLMGCAVTSCNMGLIDEARDRLNVAARVLEEENQAGEGLSNVSVSSAIAGPGNGAEVRLSRSGNPIAGSNPAATPSPALVLSADDLDDLRHMLGIEAHRPRKSWGFRNYYVGGTPGMERLVAAGFARRAVRVCDTGGDPVFYATREGCRAAGLTLGEIGRMEDFREEKSK